MRLIPYFNIALLTILIFLCFFFFFSLTKEENFLSPQFETVVAEQQENPFEQPNDLHLQEGAFALRYVPPHITLPDLRDEILFFGKNVRPDALKGPSSFHIGLKSSGETCIIKEGSPIYLLYRNSYSSHKNSYSESARPLWGEEETPSSSSCYILSPDNQPTSLWIEADSVSEESIAIHVQILNEKNDLVTDPNEFHSFMLKTEIQPKSQFVSWELDGIRVDSGLLIRQQARWTGHDTFLELHGGEEFSNKIGKERIEFENINSPYICFIGLDEFLIWKNNRWIEPEEGESTDKYPLLHLKKIEEQMITFELWNSNGRDKTSMNLVRIRNPEQMPSLSQEFKFVGAKTWSQFVIECQNGKRLTLKPTDWIILTDMGWEKLDSSEMIDNYVEGKLSGPMFVFDKLLKHDGRQLFVGHLFNRQRDEVESIEIDTSITTSSDFYYTDQPFTNDSTSLEDD